MDAGSVRIDKWLWAVRLYKTRTQAAEACRAGHVEIAGQKVKPSHLVKLDEILSAKIGIITRTVKVVGIIDRRMGASVAREHALDLTPPEEYAKLKEMRAQPVFYPKGIGRPTKKDRREIERFFSEGR
ncbi:MAG: RNA-binding S4 domain-containing protein [Verrucomicrobia bacterium]|nr:RNA-binding S4 domain-containing protein [Verrucomicrobiota bacterium]